MINVLRNKRTLAVLSITLVAAIATPLLVTAAPDGLLRDLSPVAQSGHLKFQGSTTVGPIIALTVPHYNSAKGITVMIDDNLNLLQNGSGNGRAGTILHYNDIGMSSSSISTVEGTGDPSTVGGAAFTARAGSGLMSESQVLNPTTVARDGLCFIVNDTVTDLSGTGTNITAITKAQLTGIYNGTITNWNQIIDPLNASLHGPNMTITPRARVLNSGTRASWKDSVGYAVANPDVDPPAHTASGTENATIANTDLPRLVGNVDMQAAVNQVGATGMCAYVGLGMETGTHVRALKLYNSTNTIAWSPTAINIYGANPADSNKPYYPFARFLYVVTPKYANTTFTTLATPITDIADYITWLTDVAGQGQLDVAAESFLKLRPDQDVKLDNVINVFDLVQVGDAVGQTGTPHWIRPDVKIDGVINVFDLVQVGNWVGVSIVPN